MKQIDIVREMAYALEKARVHSSKYWTKEEFDLWCHRDPFGKKSFRQAKSIALKQYKTLVKIGIIQAEVVDK